MSLELAKECEQLKERAGGASEHVSSQEGVAWEELQVVRGERDQAVSQAKDLRQTVTGLSREKQVRGVEFVSEYKCTTYY